MMDIRCLFVEPLHSGRPRFELLLCPVGLKHGAKDTNDAKAWDSIIKRSRASPCQRLPGIPIGLGGSASKS